MSSEQSLDPQLIEQTKQQIRSLVAEISQLARSEVSPEEFYGQFLTRVVSALAAAGGVVWTVGDEGRLALQYQINFQDARLHDNEQNQVRHGRLLYNVLKSGEATLVPPHSGAAGDDEAANPTDFLLVIGVLKTDVETFGLVEILQRSEAGPATQRGYLRFLTQMCDLAGDFLRGHQLRHFSSRQVLWSQLEEFTREVHVSLDPRSTAYTIANEGRRLIGCDRLSVAVRKGNRCVIEAISGQDMVDKRSNTVRLLGDLSAAVVATGDPVWYTGDTRDLAPQVEDAVQEYVDESHSKMVAVLPLKRPEPQNVDETEERPEPQPAFAALVVEQIEDSRLESGLVNRADVVCRHSAVAMGNAMEHQSLFLMPVWRAIGKSKWVLRGRTLPKTLSIGGAVLVVLLVLFIWPARFRVESKGELQPIDRVEVFARAGGDVGEPEVEHSDAVTKGELLVRLRDINLEQAVAKVTGELLGARTNRDALQYELLNNRGLSSMEKLRKQGEMLETDKRIESLTYQSDLYKAKLAELDVRSPIDGQVVTWDLRKRLAGRPVERGQVLLEVADPAGPWELELQMPEYRMGYIANAQRQLPPGERLRVEFQLATDPGTTYEGIVKDIELGTEVKGEEGVIVPVKVEISPEVLQQLRPHLRPGAQVTGKVYCGRRSLGYVLFHDVIAFVQSRILFRFF